MALLLMGGSSQRLDPEALLREGDAAFARGDFAAAANLYERASQRTTDPGRAALSLASARYRLALAAEGPSRDLQEAEELFRCCTDPGDPHRDQALFGLANCLVLKAAGHDAKALRHALESYEQCLSATHDPDLIAAAQYNRERARLLLLQVQPLPEGSDRPTGNEANEPPPRPDPQTGNARQGDADAGTDARPDPGSGTGPAQPEPGKSPVRSDGNPPPGAGNLPPIPDQVEAPPLAPRDAAAHLEQAHLRIAKEHQSHRRRVIRPAAEGTPAW
jgi:tetratricopeptide (TPR) repeat protein